MSQLNIFSKDTQEAYQEYITMKRALEAHMQIRKTYGIRDPNESEVIDRLLGKLDAWRDDNFKKVKVSPEELVARKEVAGKEQYYSHYVATPHTTHWACEDMFQKYGGEAPCCACTGHVCKDGPKRMGL